MYLVRHKMLIPTPILLQWTYSNQACFSVKSQHLLHKFCPLSANLRLFLFLKTIFWPEAVVAALWHSYTTISARTWISTRCMVQLTSTKIGCKLRKRITISRQRKYLIRNLAFLRAVCGHLDVLLKQIHKPAWQKFFLRWGGSKMGRTCFWQKIKYFWFQVDPASGSWEGPREPSTTFLGGLVLLLSLIFRFSANFRVFLVKFKNAITFDWFNLHGWNFMGL